MTTQLTKKWDGFHIALRFDDSHGDRKHEVTLHAEGKTKHDAIACALNAMVEVRRQLTEAEQEIKQL